MMIVSVISILSLVFSILGFILLEVYFAKAEQKINILIEAEDNYIKNVGAIAWWKS